MALLFFDGFDHGRVGDRGYTSIGFAGLVAGRSGSGLAADSNAAWVRNFLATKTGTTIQGAACIFPATVAAYLFQLRLGGQVQNCCFMDSVTNKVLVFRGDSGGTLLGTSTVAIPLNRWFFLEYKVLTATLGTYEVRLNGAVILTGTGNTQSQASPGADAHVFQFTNSSVDDYHVLDDTGGGPWNDYIGDRSAIIVRPTSDSSVAWTPDSGGVNYSRVNDAQPSDGDATYVAASAGSVLDLYGTAGVDGGDAIIGVQQLLVCRKTDATITQAKAAVKIGGTTYLGAAEAVPDAYSMLVTEFFQSPATGVQWTPTEFNAATFGQETV